MHHKIYAECIREERTFVGHCDEAMSCKWEDVLLWFSRRNNLEEILWGMERVLWRSKSGVKMIKCSDLRKWLQVTSYFSIFSTLFPPHAPRLPFPLQHDLSESSIRMVINCNSSCCSSGVLITCSTFPCIPLPAFPGHLLFHVIVSPLFNANLDNEAQTSEHHRKHLLHFRVWSGRYSLFCPPLYMSSWENISFQGQVSPNTSYPTIRNIALTW